jgi:hypothetical protein
MIFHTNLQNFSLIDRITWKAKNEHHLLCKLAGYVASTVKSGIICKTYKADARRTLLGKFFNCLKKYGLSNLRIPQFWF